MTIELVPILAISFDSIDTLFEVKLEFFDSYRAQVAGLDPAFVRPFIIWSISILLRLLIQTGLFAAGIFVF